MTARSQVSEQMAFDEQIIEDLALERALENRLIKKGSLDAVRKIYDGAARVGKFRITRTAIPARSVTFDTKPSSRVRIFVVGDGE